MAEGAAIRERRGSLGLWILGPVLGLAALILAIGPLPQTGCGPEITLTGSGAGVFYLTLAAVLTASALGAGLWRLTRVGSRDALIRAAGFIGAVVVALVLARFIGGGSVAGVPTVMVFLVGLVVTFCAFSILVVSWWERARVEETGLTLPVYLLGTGLFVYPTLVDIVASFTSGTWAC
ncbi:MAG TPA: hypothetical protein VHZ54_13365 [Solirubrobacterales bacterium]|jgi:hypothetical protein|nr:hypothetical protein [Solirubrobacterales bacterium]